MPWRKTSVMEQKRFLIKDYQSRRYSITELAEEYGVSRPTIYKHIRRFEENGFKGLEERSRAPHSIPHKTSPAIEKLIIAQRKRKARAGRKIIGILRRKYPHISFPAISTADAILKRNGLVEPRGRPRRVSPTKPITEITRENEQWAIDFKGEFRTGNKVWCYPLTVSDQHSRYLLGIKALGHPNFIDTKAFLTVLFKKYGLPYQILSDNGTPFAAPQALGRLSRISVWLIKLKILPVLTQPGHPEQNGRHERMHRELKKETAIQPGKTLIKQQTLFDEFVHDYNNERPHEALADHTPAEFYKKSNRELPDTIAGPEYPIHFEVRNVSVNGGFKWHDHWVGVSTCLGGENVGMEEIDDGLWQVYFYNFKLGYFDEKLLRIMDSLGRFKRNLV